MTAKDYNNRNMNMKQKREATKLWGYREEGWTFEYTSGKNKRTLSFPPEVSYGVANIIMKRIVRKIQLDGGSVRSLHVVV